jgi:hypothetical protein
LNALDRKGDNLFTDTILAVGRRPERWSGIIRPPSDPFRSDNAALVLADLTIRASSAKW